MLCTPKADVYGLGIVMWEIATQVGSIRIAKPEAGLLARKALHCYWAADICWDGRAGASGKGQDQSDPVCPPLLASIRTATADVGSS